MYTLHDNTCGEFKDNEMESIVAMKVNLALVLLYLDFWIQKYF